MVLLKIVVIQIVQVCFLLIPSEKATVHVIGPAEAAVIDRPVERSALASVVLTTPRADALIINMTQQWCVNVLHTHTHIPRGNKSNDLNYSWRNFERAIQQHLETFSYRSHLELGWLLKLTSCRWASVDYFLRVFFFNVMSLWYILLTNIVLNKKLNYLSAVTVCTGDM